MYGLEGSVAVAGSLIQWLRDNLKIIPDAPSVETLATSVNDNGGVYFVPAFSGLFAPRWRFDARGVRTTCLPPQQQGAVLPRVALADVPRCCCRR